MIDFWLLIGLKDFDPQNLIFQIIVLLTAIIILGMGISIYLQAKFPANPMDRLMEVIHERFGFSIRTAKLIAESFALILAFLFDGTIGMATVLVAFTTGYIIQFFYPKFEFLFYNTRQVLFRSEFTLFFVKLKSKKSTPLKT
ncbi:YitT family protein [Halalkalibacter kiskunsagensis]|uniref:YitT family protein n=1 Tax=Halalkalibacter kiskunsagensis TaxID=1548599 RepID=A0ABV6KGR6_9BACI